MTRVFFFFLSLSTNVKDSILAKLIFSFNFIVCLFILPKYLGGNERSPPPPPPVPQASISTSVSSFKKTSQFTRHTNYWSKLFFSLISASVCLFSRRISGETSVIPLPPTHPYPQASISTSVSSFKKTSQLTRHTQEVPCQPKRATHAKGG